MDTFSGQRAGRFRLSLLSQHQPSARNVSGVISWDGTVTASRWQFSFCTHWCAWAAEVPLLPLLRRHLHLLLISR
jgi:hypothetical protein